MLSEVHEIFQSLARLINDFGPFVFGLVAFLLIIVLLIILLIYLAKAIGNNNNNSSDDESDRIRRLEDKIDRLSGSDDKSEKDKSIIEIFLRLSDSLKKHKDIPIGLMDDLIVDLLHKHTFVIYKNENKIDAIISKLFFDEQDKTCIFSGIFEYGDGELLGFIVAEYDNVEKFEDHDLAYKLEKMAKASRQTSSAMLAISALKQ